MEIHSRKELDLRVAHEQAAGEPTPPTSEILSAEQEPSLQEIYIFRANYLLNASQQHSLFNSKF